MTDREREELRVVFMGTPEFAVPSLEAIVRAGYEVPLVVSVPDRRRGRGRRVEPSAVKRRAEELGLDVATPEKLNDTRFREELEVIAPDVICVVAFRILPESVFSIPSQGSFNLHGSLLPAYRGAAPINRAIMAGEEKTGVTTFFLKKKVDTGNIILQREIPIGPEMTAGELHDLMAPLGADLVVRTLDLIRRGEAVAQPQSNAEATPAPKIFPDDCRIDWRRPAADLHNHVRGLSPFPGAFTFWHGKRLKVLRSRPDSRDAGLEPGEVVQREEDLLVGTGSGSLALLQVQLEGRGVLGAGEFLNGYPGFPGSRLGDSGTGPE